MLLNRFAVPKDNNDFVAAAQDEARRLAPLVGTVGFREIIADKVRQTREIQKLPAVASVSFE